MAEPQIIGGLDLGNPPYRKPPEKSDESTSIDQMLYGTAAVRGATNLIQLPYTRKPLLHDLHFLTGIDLHAKGFSGKIINPNVAANLAPAPFGYINPTQYGLEPNYLQPLNNALQINARSEMLGLLPDYDPHVVAARYNANARAQLNLIESQLHLLTNEQLEQLLLLAAGPKRQQIFFQPSEVFRSARAALASRIGSDAAFEIAGNSYYNAYANELPRYTGPGVIPSPNIENYTPPLGQGGQGIQWPSDPTGVNQVGALLNQLPPDPR